jgi:regulation of enolase protein 1 (concanavalin A-like superfamily)
MRESDPAKTMWSQGTWRSEPSSWHITNANQLVVTTKPQTDFWRYTHSGATRHNGHFFGRPVMGNFAATLCLSGEFRSQYDQAGLFLLLDERTWLKTGVEYVDGEPHAGAVVTRDTSDWSIVPTPAPSPCWIKLVRQGDLCEVYFSDHNDDYFLARQCTLPEGPMQIGPFCCSPGDTGFTAVFEHLAITV